MERYIDKETGEIFEESENDTLRKETLKYIRSDDNEKYSYKLADQDYVKEMSEDDKLDETEPKDKKGKVIYNESGLPLIAERQFGLFGPFNRMYVYPFHEHSIIFGGSGSGKTESLVCPLINSIIDAGENVCVKIYQ